MSEIWKDFVHHDKLGKYQVSNLGGARRWLKKKSEWRYHHPTKDEYCQFAGTRLHRAVYMTFVGEIPEDKLIRHLNDIKHDNRVENLAIGDASDNANDMYHTNNNWNSQTPAARQKRSVSISKAKTLFSKNEIQQIRYEFNNTFGTSKTNKATKVADIHGVSYKTVLKIVENKYKVNHV